MSAVAVARIVVWLAEAYLSLGLAVALAFVAFGVERVLPEPARVTWGARLLLLPASAALWPLILKRWRRG